MNTQCNTILKAMLTNKDKKEWKASDFQYGEYFVGYEASARMSDLLNKYPTLFIVGKDGRFRTLSINWEEKELIEVLKNILEI